MELSNAITLKKNPPSINAITILIIQRLLKQIPQFTPLSLQLLTQIRREHKHPLLRNSPLNQPLQIRSLESKVLQPTRLITKRKKELCNRIPKHLTRTLPLNIRDIHTKRLSGSKMAIRVGRGGKAENSRRGDSHGNTVRDNGVIDLIARMLITWVLTGDGVTHTVAEVNTSISEADAGKRSSEQHLRLCFVVVWIADCAR